MNGETGARPTEVEVVDVSALGGGGRAGPGSARLFVLVRDRDPSGVSGTGIVAEGTQWSDGSASLRWPGRFPSVVFWQGGVDHIRSVHGHGDATKVRFVEDLRPGPARDGDRVGSPGAQEPGDRDDHHDVGGFCGCCGTTSPCSGMRQGSTRPAEGDRR